MKCARHRYNAFSSRRTRANLSAPSIASVPELQKKTAFKYDGVRFTSASASKAVRSEQSICDHLEDPGPARRGSLVSPVGDSTNVEDAVAAQKIEIRLVIHVEEIRAPRRAHRLCRNR